MLLKEEEAFLADQELGVSTMQYVYLNTTSPLVVGMIFGCYSAQAQPSREGSPIRVAVVPK